MGGGAEYLKTVEWVVYKQLLSLMDNHNPQRQAERLESHNPPAQNSPVTLNRKPSLLIFQINIFFSISMAITKPMQRQENIKASNQTANSSEGKR